MNELLYEGGSSLHKLYPLVCVGTHLIIVILEEGEGGREGG